MISIERFAAHTSSLLQDRVPKLIMCGVWYLVCFFCHYFQLLDNSINKVCFMNTSIMTGAAALKVKGKSLFAPALILICATMPLNLMAISSEFFLFSQFCTIICGFYIGIFIADMRLYLTMSFAGVLPWLIILKFYNFGAEQEAVQAGIQKDLGACLSFYWFFNAFSYVMTRQKDRALASSLKAHCELEKKAFEVETINRRLAEALKDKDDFILLFSHETRNPLNILLGNLSILLHKAKDDYPELMDKLKRCQFCSELLLQYINNILDSGKLKSQGALEITPAQINLNEYLMSSWKLLETLIEKRGLKARLIVSEDLPGWVKADTQRITQVLFNLVSNAAKFTEGGSISLYVSYLYKDEADPSVDYMPENLQAAQLVDEDRDEQERQQYRKQQASFITGSEINEFSEAYSIRVCRTREMQRNITPMQALSRRFSSEEQQKKSGYLKLEIVDTGCGMDRRALSKLFKKFAQVSLDDKHKAIGTGLGLWITKSLCNMMEGNISVVSKPGSGSCFTAVMKTPVTSPPEKIGQLYKMSGSSSGAMSEQNTLNVSTRVQTSPEKENPRISKSRERRVLIADDESYNIDLHRHILLQLGFQTADSASDGADLVEKFCTKPPYYYDFIFSDISMPNLTGIEAMTKIRKFELKEKRRLTPVGFVSGHVNAQNKEVSFAEPIKALFMVPKPISIEVLRGLVSAAPAERHGSSSARRGEDIEIVSQKQELPGEATTNPYVLCVDVDLYSLKTIRDHLQNISVPSIVAHGGKEAIDMVKNRASSIGLILMGCNMPGKDGWTAAREIHLFLSENKLPSIPLYGVIGEEKPADKHKFELSMMIDLLTKPIDAEKIKKILNKSENYLLV